MSSSLSAHPWLPALMEMSPRNMAIDPAAFGLRTQTLLPSNLPYSSGLWSFRLVCRAGGMARRCPLSSLGLLVPGWEALQGVNEAYWTHSLR